MSMSASKTLRRFGFRQTIKGALVVGAIAGLLMGAQGIAYAKAFPDPASRHKLVASLQSVSGVNFLSGEIANAATPASYAVYKSLPLMTLVTGIWGLLVATRLLRGNEEDGRLEVLTAGATTQRAASGHMLLGFGGSFLLAAVVALGLMTALGADAQVHLSVSESALMTAASFLPGIVFAGLGVLTSQLALTRSRALLYGLLPMIVLYIIRGSANSVTSVNWLKKFTPFGWSDLLNPVLDAHKLWLLPPIVAAIIFVSFGLLWAGRRDLGSALLRQSEFARSRFYLLRSIFAFGVRQNIGRFVWWGIGTVAFAIFFAALAGVSADLANDSSAFRHLFSAHSMNEFKVAFLGMGTFFIAVVLLVMATINVLAIRRDEAKGYLDNVLIQPIRRSAWLMGRLALAVISFTAISLVAVFAMWAAAHLGDVHVQLGTVMQGAFSLVGVLILTLGVGVFFYGLWPRIAVASMAIIIGWTFVVDILKSIFSLSDTITKTSVLSYIPATPATSPDWKAILWLVAIGLVLAGIGILGFNRRDIVAE